MQIRISSSHGTPIYQQVVDQVKLLAAVGRISVGERLPSVRKLAEQLLVNPNTVARAYRELEFAGVIENRAGAGAFVTNSGSPLARKEKNRLLNDRIDLLLAESKHLNVDTESLIKMIRQREQKMRE